MIFREFKTPAFVIARPQAVLPRRCAPRNDRSIPQDFLDCRVAVLLAMTIRVVMTN
jgi:hypothetical protein